MKITKELLQRHSLGICSEAERKAVEEWFNSKEDTDTGLAMVEDEEINEDRVWSKLGQLSPELQSFDTPGNIIPLYRSLARYAAAACIIFLAFFGGRFSAGTAKASPAPEDPTADHLFIFGYKDTVGNLPGNNFNIEFDGSLRLYNNAMTPKRINVGDTSFTLTSKRDHYLIGDTQNPELIVQNRNEDSFQKPVSLEGYFSIHGLYE